MFGVLLAIAMAPAPVRCVRGTEDGAFTLDVGPEGWRLSRTRFDAQGWSALIADADADDAAIEIESLPHQGRPSSTFPRWSVQVEAISGTLPADLSDARGSYRCALPGAGGSWPAPGDDVVPVDGMHCASDDGRIRWSSWTRTAGNPPHPDEITGWTHLWVDEALVAGQVFVDAGSYPSPAVVDAEIDWRTRPPMADGQVHLRRARFRFHRRDGRPIQDVEDGVEMSCRVSVSPCCKP